MRVAVALVVALAVVAPRVDAKAFPKPKRGFQMKLGKWVVQPLADTEVCEYRRLPNKKPVEMSGFALSMPPGAHHFAVWGYGGKTEDDSAFPKGLIESVGCVGLMKDDLFPQLLIPTQTWNTTYRFPPGVALSLDARQQVWLNAHMRNGDAKSVAPKIKFNVIEAKPGTVRHHVAGFTVGNMSGIDIPAGGTQTLTSEWRAPTGLTILSLASHTHSLGTHASMEVVAADGTRTPIYENDDWTHPRARDEPLTLAAGEKLRLTCSWKNPNAHVVKFGPETTDEMCFAIGFYYRTDDSPAPVVGPGCLPAKRGLLCPLAPAVASQ